MRSPLSKLLSLFTRRNGLLLLAAVGGLWFLLSSIAIVPTGHVAVGAVFGKVKPGTLPEGMHFGDPRAKWTLFDCRQKTLDQRAVPSPSGDELTTLIDWSIQYSVQCSQAASILQDVGIAQSLIEVHVIPNFRALVREHGASVEQAEDYFGEGTRARIQGLVLEGLQEVMRDKGLAISDVLTRNIQLPPVIVEAIEAKKRRQQEAETQQAELERFKIEQEEQVAAAQARYDAAELEAQRVERLARSEAEFARNLTPELVAYRSAEWAFRERELAIEKWNGVLPTMTGAGVPLVGLE